MKILHINSYYNTTVLYKNIYDLQAKFGHKITVFTSVPYGKVREKFDFGSYTLIRENHGKYDRLFFHYKQTKILNDLKKSVEVDDFDLMHSHSLFTNGYIAMKIKEQFGVPYIVAVRDTDVNTFFSKMIHLRNLGVRIMNNASRIVFLSETYRNFTISTYVPEKLRMEMLNKSIVIVNGIDDFWHKNIAEPKTLSKQNDIRILQVGDLTKRKNLTTTIEAVELLIEQGLNVSLDVVGRSIDPKIMKLASEKKFVNYHGYLAKEELLATYRKNDIFVLPSITETFGLVYPEALSQGLPIIYSEGQGFDGQIAEGKVGYSVVPKSAQDICTKIMQIIKNYPEMSMKALESISIFNWDKIKSQYDYLYRDMINNSYSRDDS